jgi:outer membrane protein assembly factor BamE (lipoprotein component of BamABCDE complex)
MPLTREFLTLVLGLALGCGCVSIGESQVGRPILDELRSKIVKGKTTRAEVLELLGAPVKIETADITSLVEQAFARYEGEQLTLKIDPALFNDVYIYEQKKSYTFILALILFNYYWSDERTDRLAVFFDKTGKVEGVGWSPGSDD